MNCQCMCAKLHTGPCEPIEAKSEPKVRYGVTITADLGTSRIRGHCLGIRSWSRRNDALGIAAKYPDECEARIVKLTRKAKPKVVAKHVTEQDIYDSCICCGANNTSWTLRRKWIVERTGKRVRVTLEELSDE